MSYKRRQSSIDDEDTDSKKPKNRNELPLNSPTRHHPFLTISESSDNKFGEQTARIIDRDDSIFLRSKGRWNIRREKMPNSWKLYLQDPFHSLVNIRLSKVLFLLVIAYLSILLVFGLLYRTVPPESCKTAISSFFQAFSFSVSVLFTIGFGTNGGDVFFGDCVWMQVVITMESLVGIFLDALAIGVLFQRFAKGQARANTIVLSTKACVRRLRGSYYFMIQVCEMRKHQLVEAHVRMYAIRHDHFYGQPYYFQSYPMRVQHPDDDIGGMLLLALPSVVVHRIDAWSPLFPQKSCKHNPSHHHDASNSYLFPEPLCRQADADNGDRECRERQRHKSDQSDISDHDRIKTSSDAIGDMIHHWKESQLEVIVLIEGIDAVTSSTIQVRQSYRQEDIVFNHQFENCVSICPKSGGAVIDFNRFHETHELLEKDVLSI
ncbi:unnamed protein product [Albugo candida]|uniref:Inward rectifier potassium channel C-terminal domain-containing protein n=1 Tax=Albugo candida TaxID=65357 RepID=A0A024GH30_9STRA|nr:unnamed protein product [Albugo candida]|eukprot:CCI45652.1 unnamed protein product [Albugo candida]